MSLLPSVSALAKSGAPEGRSFLLLLLLEEHFLLFLSAFEPSEQYELRLLTRFWRVFFLFRELVAELLDAPRFFRRDDDWLSEELFDDGLAG